MLHSRYQPWKFTILLAAMLLVLALRLATARMEIHPLWLDAAGALVLIAALPAILEKRHYRFLALLLGIPSVLSALAASSASVQMSVNLAITGRAFSIAFLCFTISMILRLLMAQREVTWDSFIGTFCGYLLIGVVWTEMYALLEIIDPESLHFVNLPESAVNDPQARWLSIQYFSFTTLTTLGYGDIGPSTPIARTLACFEAVFGQFYLAVLVAGLVGIRVSSRTNGGAT